MDDHIGMYRALLYFGIPIVVGLIVGVIKTVAQFLGPKETCAHGQRASWLFGSRHGPVHFSDREWYACLAENPVGTIAIRPAVVRRPFYLRRCMHGLSIGEYRRVHKTGECWTTCEFDRAVRERDGTFAGVIPPPATPACQVPSSMFTRCRHELRWFEFYGAHETRPDWRACALDRGRLEFVERSRSVRETK